MSALTQVPKKLLKSGLIRLAAGYGRHRRKPAQPELLILMYHRILPATDARAHLEEPGMWVSPQSFRLHLQILREFFTPMRLSDWLHKQAKGEPLPPRACAITFDDGWQDNHEYAWPILRELAMPATIFLVPGMMPGTTNGQVRFWPNRLAWLLDHIAHRQAQHWQHTCLDWLHLPTGLCEHRQDTALNGEQLSAIIAGIKTLDDSDIHQRLDTIEQTLGITPPEHSDLLSWPQMQQMQQDGLVEAGSHTCHHTRLRDSIDLAVLRTEVIQSKQQIEQQLHGPVHSFCYPNGDVSPAAEALVREHYAGAVTTQSGWNTLSSDPYRLRRIGVHEAISNNRQRFLACLSGWF